MAKVLDERRVASLSDLHQADLAAFDELMEQLSPTYGKSVKDAARSLATLRELGTRSGRPGLA